MTRTATLAHPSIVDNPVGVLGHPPNSPPFVPESPAHGRNAGRRSGAARRVIAHHWHRQARRLYHEGLSFSAIARALGRAVSTVSMLLRGKIKTLLDAEETAAGVNPYPAAPAAETPAPDEGQPFNEQSIRSSRSVSPPLPQPESKPRRKGKARWNWCPADCDKEHHHWYSPFEWARRRGQVEEWAEARYQPEGVNCACGFNRTPGPQVCPMCGRAPDCVSSGQRPADYAGRPPERITDANDYALAYGGPALGRALANLLEVLQ